MKEPNPAELDRDLGAAIAHVMGEALVALAAGCEIHLAVDPCPGGKSFEGVCWVRHPAGETPAPLKRAIGVAGCVAELAYLHGSPNEIEASEVFDKLQSSERIAGGITLDEATYALRALRSRWSLVIGEVERMSPQILSNTHRIH